MNVCVGRTDNERTDLVIKTLDLKMKDFFFFFIHQKT